MPLKLRFHLHGPPPASPFQHGAGLQALVLGWVAAGDPDTAARLHDANQPKPYAISPLWPAAGDADSRFFDVSLLVDSLAQLLIDGASRSASVQLGPLCYRLRGDVESRDSVSYPELVAQAKPTSTRFRLRLLTPTAHHAPGDFRKAIVLPSPENYFGSWLNRWNVCAPIGIDDCLLATVERHVAVCACAGRTERVEMDRGRSHIGFIGEVMFEVLKPNLVAESDIKALAALARVATYCGTGVGTTRGMGQTEVSTDN